MEVGVGRICNENNVQRLNDVMRGADYYYDEEWGMQDKGTRHGYDRR